MLRESCLSILSIDLSLELRAKFAYLPAIYYSSYIEGQWVGGKPRIKGFLGSEWMQVVVSSSRAVVQHYVICFVIVCVGFMVVPGVSYIYLSYGFLVCFVFDALHSSSYCLVSAGHVRKLHF